MSNLDNHWNACRDEAYEHLNNLELSLLDLEDRPDDTHTIDVVFRSLHSIKGLASMGGMTELADFIHDMETIIDMLRSGSLSVSRDLLEHTVSACDLIRTMMDTSETERAYFNEQAEVILTALRTITVPLDEQYESPESLAEQEKEEVYELLNELESSLLELEDTSDDKETIDRAFRALHTIKGSGALSRFNGLAKFVHNVETVFDMIRGGELTITDRLIDTTLSVCDLIRSVLNTSEDGNALFAEKSPGIVESLSQLTSNGTDQKLDTNSDESESSKTYRIRFRPSLDIFLKGTDPLALLIELRTLGYSTVIAQKDGIPPLNEINPEHCYTYWDIILTTNSDKNAIRDIFIFTEDDSELTIDTIDDSGRLDRDSAAPERDLENLLNNFGVMTRDDFDKITNPRQRLCDILIERGDLTVEDLEQVLGQEKGSGEPDSASETRPINEKLIEASMVDTGKVDSTLAEQQHVKNVRQQQSQITPVSSIRVSSDKLDTLVDLVGELVTLQARLTQMSLSKNDAELIMIAEEVERLTDELRDNTMSVRLVPIGTLFGKFKRLVRDLAKETGKKIEMTTEGAETELDKTVIERLNDPLVHLIRNSIDHGIESPQVRTKHGKAEHGVVHLAAKHSGGYVLIKITDDGRGIDAHAVREKARSRGLLENDKTASDQELFSLILSPGFSTAEKVTNVSGRGVGMDVVKRNIDDLRGSLEISSNKGIGTTITMKLPLTLAIIDGLLVKVGDSFFVLPLSIIEECVELTGSAVNSHGRNIANIRGAVVPYISLRNQFHIHENRPELEQLVITNTDGMRVGFVVDHVVDEHQTVIKSLGKAYQHVEGVSGATILGDGTLALILDASKLIQVVEEQDQGFITKQQSHILIVSS
ncbi:MAG: Hpt domain-containing protein [Nitrospiraceae bacterium]|nr:MAG: Hpt domain-containing protein [Nitrospiraceae bacterium]